MNFAQGDLVKYVARLSSAYQNYMLPEATLDLPEEFLDLFATFHLKKTAGSLIYGILLLFGSLAYKKR